jgi:catechol 2,3-dioxygenase-like lactoylglutathione lyase family enzyme
MIDYQHLFHVGVRVPDLQAAMAELGDSLGVTWAEARDKLDQSLWTPEHGLQQLPLKFTYSAQGPQHIELLEGPAGSFWDGRVAPGAHHVGVWVDSVVDETDRLIATGWTIVGAQRDPDAGKGYGAFSYLRPPSGLIVELVDRAVQPHFEQWWNAALA